VLYFCTEEARVSLAEICGKCRVIYSEESLDSRSKLDEYFSSGPDRFYFTEVRYGFTLCRRITEQHRPATHMCVLSLSRLGSLITELSLDSVSPRRDMALCISISILMVICPGGPGLAGTRMPGSYRS